MGRELIAKSIEEGLEVVKESHWFTEKNEGGRVEVNEVIASGYSWKIPQYSMK